MYTLIFSILVGASSSSVSVPNFQTLSLCQTAAASHQAIVVTAAVNAQQKQTIAASCVKTQEK